MHKRRAERPVMDLCGGGTEGLARLQLLAQVVRFLVVLQCWVRLQRQGL